MTIRQTPPQAVDRVDWPDIAERDLGLALVGGVDGSLEECYRRWAPLVNTLAWRLLGNPSEAEDITQQVFVSAWRSRHTFRPDLGTIPAWLLGNTRHRVLDRQRSRVREFRLVRAAVDGVSARSDRETAEVLTERLLLSEEIAKLPDPASASLKICNYVRELFAIKKG